MPNKLKQYRLNLIRDRTPVEQYAKSVLRSWGLKPQFQKIMRGYIVDIYLKALNVIIEIDGKQHDEENKYEQTREFSLIKWSTNRLVLHYTNTFVLGYKELFKAQLRDDLGLW